MKGRISRLKVTSHRVKRGQGQHGRGSAPPQGSISRKLMGHPAPSPGPPLPGQCRAGRHTYLCKLSRVVEGHPGPRRGPRGGESTRSLGSTQRPSHPLTEHSGSACLQVQTLFLSRLYHTFEGATEAGQRHLLQNYV